MLAIFKNQNHLDGNTGVLRLFCKFSQQGILKLTILQPPSRGCVLKHSALAYGVSFVLAAAFARLCVETSKSAVMFNRTLKQPPSRGCVLKLVINDERWMIVPGSRLRAAVC